MITPTEFCVQVKQFQEHILDAYQNLAVIEKAVGEVGEMYPAIPIESWQNRNGKGEYLYMLFAADRLNGGYSGPDGKRKVYIGNKPERIQAARLLVKNRQRYEELQRARSNQEYWINKQTRQFRWLIDEPQPKYSLGTGAPQDHRTGGPKRDR